MILAGITLSASDAVILIGRCSAAGVEVIDGAAQKIALADHEDAGALRAFQQALYAALEARDVGAVALKKCTTKGRYKSGAASMKMEAIIQLCDRPVVLIEGRDINTVAKGSADEVPAKLKRYQHDAFFTALAFQQRVHPPEP